MKIALVYDRVNKWGGAERLLLALHTIFPLAPLYTAVYDKKSAPWADDFNVLPSFLNRIPYAKTNHEYLPLLTPIAFETFDFSAFDIVLSVTSADAKGIITGPNTFHICYCLTPTRYLWSHKTDYLQKKWQRLLFAPFISYLRKWDYIASSRPDAYLTISKNVQKRIQNYYQKDSKVLYPPLLFKSLQGSKKPTSSFVTSKPFFLIVSRLVAYKHIESVINVCNLLKTELVIIGKGKSYNSIKAIAGTTIYFVSDLTDNELSWYYHNSQALISLAREDFGLTVLEAQSCGTPCIVIRDSGSAEIIINNKTGVVLQNQSEDELAQVLRNWKKEYYKSDDCIQNCKRFSFDVFKKNLIQYINNIQTI